MDLKYITTELEEKLSKKRFRHSIGTMKAAVKLAIIYKENEEKAKLAGLLHDFAKELTDSEILDYVYEFDLHEDALKYYPLNILHGPIGSKLVNKIFSIDDTEVLSAIKWHTTGKKNMSKLEKIIFIADLIEENRNYTDVEMVRELSFKNLNKSLIYVYDFTIKNLIKKNMLINEYTIEARNYLILEEKGVV